jgi:hypothetical protein
VRILQLSLFRNTNFARRGLTIAPTENPPPIENARGAHWDEVVQWLPDIKIYRCVYPKAGAYCGLASPDRFAIASHVATH